MTGLSDPPDWTGPSADPNDEQFGDVVEAATVADAADYEAVLVGEPYDGAVIGRRGAREGPAALRQALASVKTHHFEAGPIQSLGDLGDVEIPEGGTRAVQNAIQEVSAGVYDAGGFPVFLGGDNSLSCPNAAPLLERGSLGAVSLDAHLDCRATSGEPTSGTPYRQLLEAGLDAFAVVGARDFETSTAYREYVDDRGGTVVPPAEVTANLEGVVATVRAAMADVDAIYVSVDLDVLDAAHAPAVSAPTPGGLRPVALFELVRRILSIPRVAGFEVVECAPPLAESDRTARVGARTIAHALAGRTSG